MAHLNDYTNYTNVLELKQYAEHVTYSDMPPLSFNSRKIIVQQIYNLTDSIEMMNGNQPEKRVPMDKKDVSFMLNKLLYELRTDSIQLINDEILWPEGKVMLIEKIELLLSIKNDQNKLAEFVAAMREELLNGEKK